MISITHLPIVLRELEVVGITDVAPRLRRISLGGPQLGVFQSAVGVQPAFSSPGPDDHIKLFFADPLSGILTLPVQETSRLRWPRSPRALSREYTPRAFDPGSDTLELDLVGHDGGVAARWAYGADVGDRIHIAGPKASMAIPQAKRVLLFGDETAIPAIFNWCRMRPADVAIMAFVFSSDEAMHGLLPSDEGVEVSWLRKPLIEPEAFVDLLLSVHLSEEDFVWCGSEKASADALRRALGRPDFPTVSSDICNYWTKTPARDP